jgi:hypothetical protein
MRLTRDLVIKTKGDGMTNSCTYFELDGWMDRSERPYFTPKRLRFPPLLAVLVL